MNNTLTSISFSLYSNQGVYALLLGSGISRNSGIPTGWDVVLDLIRKLAVVNKEDCKNDPESWFIEKYKEEPDYSTILSKLVSTPSERLNLLKNYFEATEEEKEEQLKLPSKAHRNIAKLIKKGVVKVVVTTNFDRLLETALHDEGIEPIVIRHPDDIAGALPLVHSSFTLIKINGDYLDSRFLNTKKELAAYPKKLKDYLLRIINEYGIISCGWSGKWDTGLKEILKQAENFRFCSYWTYVKSCEKELEEIAGMRKGKTLEISGADHFFSEILEKIEALEQIGDVHPLNKDIAVARLKKYIVKEENKILLHDLLATERENSYHLIHSITDFHICPNVQLLPRLQYYEKSIDTLLVLAIHGTYWSSTVHEDNFISILSRLSEPPKFSGSFYEQTLLSHYYPVLLLFYAMGIAAIKAGQFSLLNKMFKLKISENRMEHASTLYFIENINSSLFDKNIFNIILNRNFRTPMSSYICEKLQHFLGFLFYTENDFRMYFDIFEYLLSLNYSHIVGEQYGIYWVPVGEYNQRIRLYSSNKESIFNDFFAKAEKEKELWKPIKEGMFNSSYIEYAEAKAKVDKFLKSAYVF